jgi:hypothetical protein
VSITRIHGAAYNPLPSQNQSAALPAPHRVTATPLPNLLTAPLRNDGKVRHILSLFDRFIQSRDGGYGFGTFPKKAAENGG